MRKQPRNKRVGSIRRYEHIALGVCILLFIGALSMLTRKFYLQNTEVRPTQGGTYVEGSVGQLKPLNPWFTVTNDVNRDIISLVFAGLLKYNPNTQSVEEDLATLEVDANARIYTVTLHENLFWHDSTEQEPHPVTADDILFTFQTIQNPDFPNKLLQQNFQGVTIDKLDERTVRFKLEEPYSFFASNLTLGLLPQKSFEGIPVAKLDQALGFGFQPIGAGPYKFVRITPSELHSEVVLERFSRPFGPKYHLEQIIFRIFPNYSTLLSDLSNFDGVRLAPRNSQGDPVIPQNFRAFNYTLPQYVALFLNTERSILKEQQLRLGIQLAIDKANLTEGIGERILVDTPLLEIDTSDWRYQFDPQAAQGALHSSNWHLQEKIRLQRLLEMREVNQVGVLQSEPVALLQTGALLTFTGAITSASSGGSLHGIALTTDSTHSGTWIAHLPTENQTGALQIGYNFLQLKDEAGNVIDSHYILRTDSEETFNAARDEQDLLKAFITSRDGDTSEEEQINVSDLYLENNFLRRRFSNDPTKSRMNTAGEKLVLTLLTSPNPTNYTLVAENIKQQLQQVGIGVRIDVPETRAAFQDRLLKRDYDMLLFGQSLLDNLDSYPYWHSSGIQQQSESLHSLRIDAYNLSQYRSLRADTLLEMVRFTTDETQRNEALEELREILKEDIPAIFLYSPLYTFAADKDIQGITIDNLSLHSDKFLALHNWYKKEGRIFKEGKSWWSFPGWLFSFARAVDEMEVENQ